MRAVDLGCGTGELTRQLHERLGCRETLGLDRSAKMLEKSAAFAAPGLRFEKGTVEVLRPGRPLRPRLLQRRAPLRRGARGALAAPRLASSPRAGRWRSTSPRTRTTRRTSRPGRSPARSPSPRPSAAYVHPTHLLPVEAYATLFHRLGFARQSVKLVVYTHLLESRESVVEWVKGSILTEYQSRLAPELYERFLETYRERLLPASRTSGPTSSRSSAS